MECYILGFLYVFASKQLLLNLFPLVATQEPENNEIDDAANKDTNGNETHSNETHSTNETRSNELLFVDTDQSVEGVIFGSGIFDPINQTFAFETYDENVTTPDDRSTSVVTPSSGGDVTPSSGGEVTTSDGGETTTTKQGEDTTTTKEGGETTQTGGSESPKSNENLFF